MSDGYAPLPTVTYCTPEDVADTLDLPDPNDAMGKLKFTDISHPTYRHVLWMIKSNEDIIDRRLRKSWRENIVRDKLNSIQTYWHDINGRRSDYYMQGGNYVQLRKDMREWNPFPVQTYVMEGDHAAMQEASTPDGKPIYIPKVVDGEGTGEYSWVPAYDENGARMHTSSGVPVFVNVEELMGGTPAEGEYMRAMTPVVDETLYEGDKIIIRSSIHNMWRDSSFVPLGEPYKDGISQEIWFDYPYGKLYIRVPAYNQYKANALKITYRCGSEEPVPAAIKRLCCLLTATQILAMQYYNVKVGIGGDLGNVKNDTINMWQTEMNSIWSSFQRSGSVHSMLR